MWCISRLPLKVGENIIEIQYEAALDIAGSGFLNDFSLQYYTPFEGYSKDYPPVEVTMDCANDLILKQTSLKVSLEEANNTFRWQASDTFTAIFFEYRAYRDSAYSDCSGYNYSFVLLMAPQVQLL